jgi:tetratricopeptide (TPR) repeat protein
MEILKKSFVIIAFIFCSIVAIAQSDAALQTAFSESYTAEYNKKYTEAIAALSKFNTENSYELNLRLGWLHYSNKNYTQAQNFYQHAVSLKPYSVEAKLGYVKVLAVQENWDKVLIQYGEILKIDPQNYTANYWTGVIFYNRKKYEAAAKYFEKIVNLYPFDYDATHMMAWSCFNNGRSNDAKTLFLKALLMRPNDASCLEGLSKIK